MKSTTLFKMHISIKLADTLQKQLLFTVSVWGGGGKGWRSSYSSLPNKPGHSWTSDSEQLLCTHTTVFLSSHRVCSGHPHVVWIKAALKLHYSAVEPWVKRTSQWCCWKMSPSHALPQLESLCTALQWSTAMAEKKGPKSLLCFHCLSRRKSEGRRQVH